MADRTRVTVIGLAIVFLALNAAYGQGQEKYHQGGQGKKEALLKELKLTPEQEKKIEDNRRARRQNQLSIRTALKVAHEKLQVKLNNPAVTKAEVEPFANEIKSLQARMVDNRINGIFEVKAILTPEQYVKFNQIMEKRVKAEKGQPKGAQDKPKGPPSGLE